MQFYPENATITVNPLQGSGELRYILSCSHPLIYQKDITLKYAFAGKWKISSPALKSRIREILVHILDIVHFEIRNKADKWVITVPLKPLKNLSLLPDLDKIEIPVVVKLQKKESPGSPEFQLKCYQTLSMITSQATQEKETDSEEMYLSLPLDEEKKEPDPDSLEESPSAESFSSFPIEKQQEEISSYLAQMDDISVFQNTFSDAFSLKPHQDQFYKGIMAIDFGTTNSVVVIRDPLYAAEEIKEDLSKEQWKILAQWVDSWIIQHLSVITPSEENLYVEELSRMVSEMDLPPCGSLSVDIWEELQKLDIEAREQFIMEIVAGFSIYNQEQYSHRTLRELSWEFLFGLEQSIYSKTLESQRYFILELEENAGPGPISSTMQILSAPYSGDQQKLEEETQVELGERVHLLMRSAAIGEADIRQFAINIKRYFGQEQAVSILPSEAAAAPISFNPDTLCRLAYKKLISRSLEYMGRKANQGELQYANKIQTLVATFPTTYPASLRRRLRDMMNDMEIQSIDTRFDEGTASAVYYIWQEVCADPVCGMYGLMARCRRDRHDRAYQNILLYDLGGGTTDIALIQLIYEELPIFEPLDKTKSEGGRYFRITPRLLGSTGHRYIGGDLITLWLFRLLKTKLVDKILHLLEEKKIEPPSGSELSLLLSSLPEEFCGFTGEYREGSLLEWTFSPGQNLRRYDFLNNTILNLVIPTMFENDSKNTANFFTLWDIMEETKKKLGTPTMTYTGSGLGQEWLEEIWLDHETLWGLVTRIHPWISSTGLKAEDFKMAITQEELGNFALYPVHESLNLALNLAKARLRMGNISDKLDRFILSGLSCSLQVVQNKAKEIFQSSEGLFDFNLANVFFHPEIAKTSVAMGACIGRYLESVRLDPGHEKTRQMLREGYDQIDLVVENLFTHLACRLVYDSLVAMVEIFDHGQELNRKSFVDGKPVARTPMDSLRPVQEKFWIYRLDFEGATPQYLGLINAEATAYSNGFEDFRKFREQYLVGFEADAELFVRAFFIPRGPKNILAIHFLEDTSYHCPARSILEENNKGMVILKNSISSQELFQRKVFLPANTAMVDTIQYPDGSRYRCALSESLPIREMYDFYIEGLSASSYKEPKLISHFGIENNNNEEMVLACDETGRVVLLLSCIYDIKIWADIDYQPQKVDAQYDPFCGQH